jgi:hypothetical protein
MTLVIPEEPIPGVTAAFSTPVTTTGRAIAQAGRTKETHN